MNFGAFSKGPFNPNGFGIGLFFALFSCVPAFAALSYISPFSSAFLGQSLTSAPVAFTRHDESSEPASRVTELQLKWNSTFYKLMRNAGLSHELIMSIVDAAKPFKNLSRLPPQTRLDIHWEHEGVSYPTKINIHLGGLRKLIVERLSDSDEWAAREEQTETRSQLLGYRGVITSTFWQSAMDAGLNPRMTAKLGDIFGSLVDFAREVQRKDRWRLVVERIFVRDQAVGWGDIVSAEVEVDGVVYSASYFPKKELKHNYFALNGTSLKRMFLKSPIPFGRVTSKFSFARYHPVLKIRRPHLGVDYGAPIGTPVRAAGDGLVTFAQRNGSGGKTVKIRHNNSYRTHYLHLSRFEKGVFPGKRVAMGDVIGYVGRTGRVTGPHLHYEFYVNEQVVDPLGVEFPSSDPIPEEMLPEFMELAEEYRNFLPEWPENLQAGSPSAGKGA